MADLRSVPIVRAFAEPAGITIQTSDISVAARILAEFSDYLTEASSACPTTWANWAG